MEVWQREKLFEIVGRYLGDDEMHGRPHIERVYANFKKLENHPSIPNDALEALEVSILLHDVGRKSSLEKHAAASANIIGSLFKKGELSWVQRPDWVLHAIYNHSTGVGGRSPQGWDLVLALLCVFDHMDCLGAIGIHRMTIYWCGGEPFRIPWVPELNQVQRDAYREKLKCCLANPKATASGRYGVKPGSSFLETLVYYICVTEQIVDPVIDLLGIKILNEIEFHLVLMRQYVRSMIAVLL